MTLPFADTICDDERKIIDAIFKKSRFADLHSALAYCDGYVDGVMNKHDINIDDYDLEIE